MTVINLIEYYTKFEQYYQETNNQILAYFLVENDYKKLAGFYRYSGYESFRKVRSRLIQERRL